MYIQLFKGAIILLEHMISDDCGGSRYKADINIKLCGNLFFDKYDVEFFIDGISHGMLIQGSVSTYSGTFSSGSHTVTFCREGIPSVKGSAEFDVDDDMHIALSVKCRSSVIDIERIARLE